jgi:hypothetical protein
MAVSDPVLITDSNRTYTCNADSYTLQLMPTADMYGDVTITVIATDAGYLTDTIAFALSITPVNDTPVITSDITFSMNEDAIALFTLTATDLESADCSMDITFASSDLSLLQVENISYTCASGVYYISITPVANESGNAALTITVTDSGSLSATQSIALTVISVNDPPQIGDIADETMDEDTTSSSISFTVTDFEGQPLTMTCQSSDTSLISTGGIIFYW